MLPTSQDSASCRARREIVCCKALKSLETELGVYIEVKRVRAVSERIVSS